MFLFAHRAFELVQTCVRVLFEGLWLGILSERHYDAICELRYDHEIYADDVRLDSGFLIFEKAAVERYFHGGSVLVAAAGGGREMIALTRAGFEADGFDCARGMVEAGQRALAARNIAGRLLWAPASRAPKLDKIYDGLIVGWNGYTYILPRSRRIEFLQSLRAHLKPGSPILISGSWRPEDGGGWTCRIANTVRGLTLRPRVFEPGDEFPGQPRHSFSRKQLVRELADAGFVRRAFYRWGPQCAAVAVKAEQSE